MVSLSWSRLKVQLSDASQGTRSPLRHSKCNNDSNGESLAPTVSHLDELNCEGSSTMLEPNSNTSGNSENWMVLSISGEKPVPRFNHAAAVIGNKMVVVGGESGNGLLEDVQVLNFDQFNWTSASSKQYLSPASFPLKIPACKGHCLVSWGKKVLLVGGKIDPASDRVSVRAFDVESECWSLMDAKGDIPVARSGHSVVRASSVLILFGGEDIKRRKLNDLFMFDLKSLTWLPLHCIGSGPSPRSNHVAALYDDRILFIFGGTTKSRTLNDMYSLDFETMCWSRMKIRGFHPSPRAGCCGVLCGPKWYIAGGGSKKKRHAETLVFDVLKVEWSVAITSPSSSITTNKGFSLVLVQHKDKDFLVAFGGSKKEPSNQVEVLIMDKHDASMGRRSTPGKGLEASLFENHSSKGPATQLSNSSLESVVDSVARQNLASAIENHGSGRRSVSVNLVVDPGHVSGCVSLRKQFQEKECHPDSRAGKTLEDESPWPQGMEQKMKQLDIVSQASISGGKGNAEELASAFESENLNFHNLGGRNVPSDNDDALLSEVDIKSRSMSAPSSICQLYETKLTVLIRRNRNLEAQLEAALASHEAAEKNLSSALKSRQELEKKLVDAMKGMELLKEKLLGIELAQEEANSLSNMVHSDNVRLEHDVAFLKAVLDDTQKELHSTRGVLAGERARAFQLQFEVFHLKQRLQSMENRAPTPRKPYHV
ncbi:Kelch repeat type 1 [Dillenia turbinata]|uniref:Kelch repeat type 1 n=1 Tax=Dillenia turbinata TaxID=194707 RepID=A0AAN8ZCQ5_9MAGN